MVVATAPLASQALNLGVVSRGCSVSLSSGPSQSIPANTAVPNGYQISVTHPRGTSATSTLAVTPGSSVYEITLHDRTTYNAAAATTPFVATFLDISLAAPRRGRLRLDASCNASLPAAGNWTGSGYLSIGGQTILSTWPGSSTTSRVLDIGPNPVVMQLRDDTVLSFPANIRWTLRMTPVSPCTVTSYGPRCGADLVVEDDLLQFSRPRVTLLVNGQPTPGLLVAGFQRRAIPVGPCTLLNEALVALPIGGVFNLEPPQIPGYSLKLQGAALVSGQLVASAGLDFLCQ